MEWLKDLLGEGYSEEIGALCAERIGKEYVTREEHEAALNKARLDHAVERALTGAGARNLTAARALLAGFLDGAQAGEDGTVPGLCEEVERLAEDEGTGFLFETPGRARLAGLKPGESGGGVPPMKETGEMSYAELCAYLEEHPEEE